MVRNSRPCSLADEGRRNVIELQHNSKQPRNFHARKRWQDFEFQKHGFAIHSLPARARKTCDDNVLQARGDNAIGARQQALPVLLEESKQCISGPNLYGQVGLKRRRQRGENRKKGERIEEKEKTRDGDKRSKISTQGIQTRDRARKRRKRHADSDRTPFR